MLMRRSVLLALAFASLLLIIGGSAFAIWHGAENARRKVAELHEAHLEAGNALASIRANVFLERHSDARLSARSRIASHAARYAAQFRGISAAAPNAALERSRRRRRARRKKRRSNDFIVKWTLTGTPRRLF